MASFLAGIVLGILAPLAIAAPRRFAGLAGRHPLVTPVTVAILLVPAWLHAMSRTFGIEHKALILGAFGLAGLWAVATILGIGLVSRWEESDRSASVKAASLVFSFGGGFCLFLLVYYYFAIPAIRDFLEPRLPSRIGTWVTLDVVITGMRLTGLLLAAIAPVQIFRGLASVGGGAGPGPGTAVPRLRLQPGGRARNVPDREAGTGGQGPGRTGLLRVRAASWRPRWNPPPARARPGRAARTCPCGRWLRTLREIIRQPREFFEHLPLDASRRAAVRFWELEPAGDAGGRSGPASPPTSASALSRGSPPRSRSPATSRAPPRINVPTPFWLPATITGRRLVTWAMVMAGTILLCATAEYVWKRTTLLRGRNMHPAGLLTACYLSGHVFAIEVAATAAFLGMRLAVLAIPADSSPIPFDALMPCGATPPTSAWGRGWWSRAWAGSCCTGRPRCSRAWRCGMRTGNRRNRRTAVL